VKVIRTLILSFLCLAVSLLPACADQKSDWLKRWNSEREQAFQLKAEDVVFKESTDPRLKGLAAVGIRQSDGGFSLSQIIWRGSIETPLRGFGQVLSDLDFSTLDDQERRSLFLSLLQQTYGAIGHKPFTGPPSRSSERPVPILELRGPDGSHRFQVWFCELPINTEDAEWREVMYSVSADGSSVKARTLGSYRPIGERLRGFPTISSELFE